MRKRHVSVNGRAASYRKIMATKNIKKDARRTLSQTSEEIITCYAGTRQGGSTLFRQTYEYGVTRFSAGKNDISTSMKVKRVAH